MSSAVIIGATSGVGRSLARKFAQSGYRLIVVARDPRDLEATATDIRIRFEVECHPVTHDIGEQDWDVDAFALECMERLDGIDCVLVPAGAISPDDVGPNASVLQSITASNYLGPARLAAAFGRLMLERGKKGTIILFSSIAAAAPRAKNAAYSAAKRALETYATGLRTVLEPRGIKLLVLALGYVDTPLSFGMRLLFPVASPDAVADYIVRRGRRASGKRHFPRFWWWITIILRHLPWFIYRRLSF